MTETFEDLGLRPELVSAATEMGYEVPTALQRAAIPVLRRGGNAMLHEGPGAGLLGAYGMPLLDRLSSGDVAGVESEGGGRLKALILVAGAADAARTALTLARLARPLGLRVSAMGPGWATAAPEADVLVATPAASLDAVRGSALKLDALRALVFDGLDTFFDLGLQEAIETLTTFTPKDAQRVVTTTVRTDAVADYVDRHVRRPMTIPPTPIEDPQAVRTPTSPIRVGYAVVPAAEKMDTLAMLLVARAGAGATVYARGRSGADAVAGELALRGFATGPDGNVRVRAEPMTSQEGVLAISYDVPFDPDDLRVRHATGGLVLVEPRHLPHLRLLVDRAGFALHADPVALPPARDAVADFRDRIRRALSEEDLDAQLLVLEPLFSEYSAAEVAAAASSLLRRRTPTALVISAPTRAAAPAAPDAFVRLFVSLGSRDGIRPGDLVGAITGEANVPGDRIGRIELRESLSIVEVGSDIAERVILALNGTTMRGRSLRVDYDRPGGGGAGRGSAAGGGRGPGTGGSRPPGRSGGPGGRPEGGPRTGGTRRPPPRDFGR